MCSIIMDIASRTSETLKGLYKRPESILIEMWYEIYDEQIGERMKRSNSKPKESDADVFERLKQSSGSNL